MANVSNLCYGPKENMKNLKIICRKCEVGNKMEDNNKTVDYIVKFFTNIYTYIDNQSKLESNDGGEGKYV